MANPAPSGEFQPRRGKARLRLGIPAELITLYGRSHVTLLDLSESGARLRYDGPRIIDAVIEWLGYEAFGVVVRCSGGEIGLRFDQPIQRDCVLDTRERLPSVMQAEDQLARFAREWVHGSDRPRVSAHVSGLRAELPRQGPSFDAIHAVRRKRGTAVRNWLRAAAPFILAGVAVGLLAGYWSNFF